MKSSFLFLFAFTLVAGATLAQEDRNYLHNRTVMERIPLAGTTGNTISLGNMAASPVATRGDVYLNPDYRITTFWLYEGEKVAQGFAARLDMQRNEFDIHMGPGNPIKALSGTKVRTLVWADSLTRSPQYFVNGQEYKNEDGVPFIGFFQILSEGELTLLKMTRVSFKPADHNPTHATGTKDNRFMKRTDLYYAVGTKVADLPGRKGITNLMESRKKEIDKFIKVNEINLGSERHIVALFDYYNSITKK